MKNLTTKGNTMKIKEFKLDNNGWAEVTWVQELISASEEGVENITEVAVHCESYSGHPKHIAMIADRAEKFGTPLDEYSELIAELASTYIAPTQAELDEAERVQKLSEAYAYLESTKWYIERFADPSSGKAIPEEVLKLRADAREYISNNRGA